MKKYRILLMILSVAFTLPIYAQNDSIPSDSIKNVQIRNGPSTEIEMPTIIPPSPNAQTFLKYGDHPVSNFTGVPDISIPIYNIQMRGLEIPITLSYNASGIKVNEEASRVGLGWALNAGGVISRTMVGVNDYGSSESGIIKYLNTPSFVPDFTYINIEKPLTTNCYLGFSSWRSDDAHLFSDENMKRILYFNGDNSFDLCPDVFHYNFNGYIGSFSITHSGRIIKEKNDNIIINPKTRSSSDVQVWEVITPDGTTYTFAQPEYHRIVDYRVKNDISSWYLTEIKNIHGNVIQFSYKNYPSKFTYTVGDIEQYFRGEYVLTQTDPVTKRSIYSNIKLRYDLSLRSLRDYDIILLEEVTFPNGSLYFQYNDTRKDLPKEFSLQSIRFMVPNINKPEEKIELKRINLNYDYFEANDGGKDYVSLEEIKLNWPDNTQIAPFGENWNKYRLKLQSVDEVASNIKSSYSFKYNETRLPTKLTTARDHWNYYNGKRNSSIVPQYFTIDTGGDEPLFVQKNISEVNREVDEDFSKAFVLEDIIYPTGGKTSFEYGSNKFNVFKNIESDPYRKNYLSRGNNFDLERKNGDTGIPFTQTFSRPFEVLPEDCDGTAKGYFTIKLIRKPQSEIGSVDINKRIKVYVKKENSNTAYAILADLNDYNFSNHGSVTSEYETRKEINLSPGIYYLIVEGGDKGHYAEYLKSYSINANWFSELDPNSIRILNAGGLRIKKIKNIDNEQIVRTKLFEYADSEATLITPYPRYRKLAMKVITGHVSSGGSDKVLTNEIFLSSNGLRSSKSPVGYGDVTIYESENLLENKSNYQYITKPDEYMDYSFPSPYIKGTELGFEGFDRTPEGFPMLSLSGVENGALIRETQYRNTHKSYPRFRPVREVIYEYDTEKSPILWGLKSWYDMNFGRYDDPDYVYGFCESETPQYDWVYPGVANVLTGYLYPAVKPQWQGLKKKTERIYDSHSMDPNYIETEQIFQYNSLKQLVREDKKNSTGETQTVSYKYTRDADHSINIVQRMETLNMLDKIFEVKKELNGNFTQLINNYSSFNANIPLLSIVLSNTNEQSTSEPRLVYYNYDSYGNPQYISRDDATNIVYLWSYSGQYPIAEIKNATYQEVKSALSWNDNTVNSLSGKLFPSDSDWNLINGLRTSLPDAMITIYKYKPLVGVSEIIDPRGVTTYYEYDNLGRLKETYIYESGVKKLVQSYDYQYRNQ